MNNHWRTSTQILSHVLNSNSANNEDRQVSTVRWSRLNRRRTAQRQRGKNDSRHSRRGQRCRV